MPTTLRRVVDVVCITAAVGMLAGIGYAVNGRITERRTVQDVTDDVNRFRQVLASQAAANATELNPRGWPTTVDPQWFGGEPPRNGLVSPERPWVEVATADEASLTDPMIRMTINPRLASFWYNPFQGIVRARVPVSISDRRALEMYNAINGTSLDEIYSKDIPKAMEKSPQPGAEPSPAPDTTASAEPEGPVGEEPAAPK